MKTRQKSPRKARLGELEMRVLGYAQSRRLSVVRIGELREALGLTATQERVVFSRLAQAGTIVRIKREVYLLPPRLPISGVWSVSPYRILYELMRASNDGQYQLCGWEVFRNYGFTDQVSNRLYAYNNRISGDRTIGGADFTLIKVSDARFGAIAPTTAEDGIQIRMPSLSRALMDAVYDWSRFDTLPRAYGWIREAVSGEPSLVKDLVDVICRFGNQSTIRRLGFVLSERGLKPGAKRKMKGLLKSAKSIVPLVPNVPATGKVDETWGVIVNE